LEKIIKKNSNFPETVDDVLNLLSKEGYVANKGLATSLLLSMKLKRPLLLEGKSGVGKTELAKSLSKQLGRDLLKLQCYEGLGVNEAIYDWNYPAQLLAVKLSEFSHKDSNLLEDNLFSDKFLIKRPLLESLMGSNGNSPILLIDEIDRADSAFEAILLEILSEYQFTIPEYGIVKSLEPPLVIVTSNNTREVHSALRRRCVYHYVDWPSINDEKEILSNRIPEANKLISDGIKKFIHSLRKEFDGGEMPPLEEQKWASIIVELDNFELEPKKISNAFKAYFRYKKELSIAEKSQVPEILRRAQLELEDLTR
tara:strand:- start:56432 stop:57367 length:936 start_codon:yes stop_codon:yes gene_type:complete